MAMDATQSDPWHDLLTNRYVCEVCLTRYFTPHRRCTACGRFGKIVPLVGMLTTLARDDEELRTIIHQGQIIPEDSPEPPQTWAEDI
jgi:hypothetical protein